MVIFCLQVLTFIIAFISVYYASKNRIEAIFASLLFETLPYRLYFCVCKRDIAMSFRWMLLPVLFVLAHLTQKINKKVLRPFALLSILSLAIIVIMPYSNSAPLASITDKGYTAGAMLSFWRFEKDCPGLGFGLLLSLFACVWVQFVHKNRELKGCINYLKLSLVFALASLQLPLWDYIERVNPMMLRFVSNIGSPSFLFGLACALMCVPCAKAQAMIIGKREGNLAVFVPTITMLLAIVSAVYIIASPM